MIGPWRAFIGRSLAALALAVSLGWFLGDILLTVLLATAAGLGWHLFHIYRLFQWLQSGSGPLPSATGGIWAEIYNRLQRFQQRHRQRELKLTEILDQYQHATAAVPDAAAVINNDDEVIWCNDAAERLLGLRTKQDVGQPIVNLVRHPAFVGFLSERRYTSSVEFPAPTDGTIFLCVRIIRLGNEQRLLLATDNTRVRRLEQIRRDFVANVSHELRTPLTVIRGYLETLLDSGNDLHSRWREPARRMQEQAARMQRIIEDLLMLSRLEAGTPREPHRPISIPALITTIVADAELLAKEHAHVISCDIDPKVGMMGHEQELRSAFSNLVYNAVRYTPERGAIVIRWFADDKGLHFAVEDNGEGIAAQHIPRLTERFYRVDRGRQRSTGGTGLGLAIVNHVMSRHQGKLTISSQVGVGSSFACDFSRDLQVLLDDTPIADVEESHICARN